MILDCKLPGYNCKINCQDICIKIMPCTTECTAWAGEFMSDKLPHMHQTVSCALENPYIYFFLSEPMKLGESSLQFKGSKLDVFYHRPYCTVTFKSNFAIFNGCLLFLKAFSWETDLWVMLVDFALKKLYLAKNPFSRNEIYCMDCSHSYMNNMCAKEVLDSNFY